MKSKPVTVQYTQHFVNGHLEGIDYVATLSGVTKWSFAQFAAAHADPKNPVKSYGGSEYIITKWEVIS